MVIGHEKGMNTRPRIERFRHGAARVGGGVGIARRCA